MAVLRELCFADVPLADWKPRDRSTDQLEPWASFERARQNLQKDPQSAADILYEIANRSGLESRQSLEAWHGLRELGFGPPAKLAKKLYGVVVEVPSGNGLDVLAAYTDYTARYINYTGRATIWETRTAEMDSYIDGVLRQAEQLLQRIGPITGPRPGPPPAGEVRINILTSSGLCYGQGSWDALSKDSLGGPLLGGAAKLMNALVDITLSDRA